MKTTFKILDFRGPSLSYTVAAITFVNLLKGHDITDQEIVEELKLRFFDDEVLKMAMSMKRSIISRVRCEVRKAMQDQSAIKRAFRECPLFGGHKGSPIQNFLANFYEKKRLKNNQ
jgi:hypothetical protein